MEVNGNKAALQKYTVEHLINEIVNKKIRKIVVLTGAGISTPSGIPDFRTAGTGLYDNLDQFDVPYPEAIFERNYFDKNPKPFFNLTKNLLPDLEKNKPNKIHYFLRLLQEKNFLHRLYTQNIDGLECLSGIDSRKLIEAHGSFRTAKCTFCNCSYSGLYVKNQIINDKIPMCKIGRCSGIVKPDIVFFGESLPEIFYKMHENDLNSADLVLVMGTSLAVEPFANIIKKCRNNVPRLLMNRDSVGPFQIKLSSRKKDLQILGDLISCVEFFVEKLGWTLELENLMVRESNQLVNKNLMDKFYFSNRNILERSHSAIDLKKFKALNSYKDNEIKNANNNMQQQQSQSITSYSNAKKLLTSFSNLSITCSGNNSIGNNKRSKINLNIQKCEHIRTLNKLENIKKQRSMYQNNDKDDESESEIEDKKRNSNKTKKTQITKFNSRTRGPITSSDESDSDSDKSIKNSKSTSNTFYRSNNSSQFSNYSFNSSLGTGSNSSFLVNSNFSLNHLLPPNHTKSKLDLRENSDKKKESVQNIFYRNSLFKANSKSATLKKDLINAQI